MGAEKAHRLAIPGFAEERLENDCRLVGELDRGEFAEHRMGLVVDTLLREQHLDLPR
jgi:hypothetical protein